MRFLIKKSSPKDSKKMIPQVFGKNWLREPTLGRKNICVLCKHKKKQHKFRFRHNSQAHTISASLQTVFVYRKDLIKQISLLLIILVALLLEMCRRRVGEIHLPRHYAKRAGVTTIHSIFNRLFIPNITQALLQVRHCHRNGVFYLHQHNIHLPLKSHGPNPNLVWNPAD